MGFSKLSLALNAGDLQQVWTNTDLSKIARSVTKKPKPWLDGQHEM